MCSLTAWLDAMKSKEGQKRMRGKPCSVEGRKVKRTGEEGMRGRIISTKEDKREVERKTVGAKEGRRKTQRGGEYQSWLQRSQALCSWWQPFPFCLLLSVRADIKRGNLLNPQSKTRGKSSVQTHWKASIQCLNSDLYAFIACKWSDISGEYFNLKISLTCGLSGDGVAQKREEKWGAEICVEAGNWRIFYRLGEKKKLLHQSTDAGFCLLTSAPIHLRTVTLLDQGDA